MLKIYIDAATKGNPGPSGCGVLITGDGLYQQLSFPLTILTNHQAEFAALECALTEALAQNLQNQSIFLYTDSQVVAQVIDQNTTSNLAFHPYLLRIQDLLKHFQLVIIQWIPEKDNRGADNLARQGLQKALKNA